MESKCQLGCYLFIYLIYPSHPFLTRQRPLRFLFIVSVRVEKALPALSFSVSLSAHLPIFLFILSQDLCTLLLLWWNYLINSVFSIDYLGHVKKDSVCLKCEICNVCICTFVSLCRAGSHEGSRWLTVVLVKPSTTANQSDCDEDNAALEWHFCQPERERERQSLEASASWQNLSQT